MNPYPQPRTATSTSTSAASSGGGGATFFSSSCGGPAAAAAAQQAEILAQPQKLTGEAQIEAAVRAASIGLLQDSRYGGQLLMQHAQQMQQDGGGVGGGGGSGGGAMQGFQGRPAPTDGVTALQAQYQHLQSLSQQTPPFHLPGQPTQPQPIGGHVRNPDGTPLLDHRYQPIPLQKILQTRPLRADISTRPGPGGIKLTYMSGEVVTRTLNELFGFHGWSMEVRETRREQCTQDSKGRYHVHYTATVRITHVASGSFREDVGANDSIDKSLGGAVANSMKGAVTDAMKRAARQFGEKLGNSLYDSKFTLKQAPMNLASALDTYDLDRNKATFFEKDRKRPAPSSSAGAAAAGAASGGSAGVGTAAGETAGTTAATATGVAASSVPAPSANVKAAAKAAAVPPPPPPPAPTAATPRGPMYGKQPGSTINNTNNHGNANTNLNGAGLGVVVGRTPGNGPLHGKMPGSLNGTGTGSSNGISGRPSLGVAAQPQPQKNMPYTPAIPQQRPQLQQQQHGATAMATTTARDSIGGGGNNGGYPSITPGPATAARLQHPNQSTMAGGNNSNPTLPSQSYGPPSARQNLSNSGLFGPSQALTDVTQTANIGGEGLTTNGKDPVQELARPGTSRGRPSVGDGALGGTSLSVHAGAPHQQTHIGQGALGSSTKRPMGQETFDPLANASKRAALGMGDSSGTANGSETGGTQNPYSRNV